MRALVIGGTGPTGPLVVEALAARAAAVTILHRGVHEPDDSPVLDEVEHIHADPHFREPLDAALSGRSFDVVVAMYGRMALNAEVLADRCDRFVSVGGNPVHRGHLDRRTGWPDGMKILADEHGPATVGEDTSRQRFAAKVRDAEEAVMAAHRRGAFRATHLRYPMIYGRRAPMALERWAVRRLLEGRGQLLVPDGGLSIYSRCADANAVAVVAAVLDRPDVAAGQRYQCADDEQYSVAQWLQLIGAALGVEPELVPVPLAWARPVWPLLPTGPLASPHTLVDTTKARRELGYRDVVWPPEALAALVHEMAGDPGLLGPDRGDPDAEAAVIAATQQAADRLARSLGWDAGDDERPDWHPYPHPRTPADPGGPADRR